MSDKEEDFTMSLEESDQERISGCYIKTTEYYGELPEACSTCADFDICFTLDTQNIIKQDKGVD